MMSDIPQSIRVAQAVGLTCAGLSSGLHFLNA